MPYESISTLGDDTRVEALRKKHDALKRKVDEAQKSLSSSDFYINQLKKQKLLIKEKISVLEQRESGSIAAQ